MRSSARAAEKDRIAKERIAAAAQGDTLKYKGKHNHAPEALAAAAAQPKKRRHIFMDDEAEEAEEAEEDEYD